MRNRIFYFCFLSFIIINVKAQTWAWAQIPGYATNEGASIAVDQTGNIFTTGFFYYTISFGTYTLTNSGGEDSFLTKYDPNGNVLWAKSWGGSQDEQSVSTCTDPFGNVFVAGTFNSPTLTLGINTLTTNPAGSTFIAKFDSNGNVLWAQEGQRALGGSLCCDPSGNVYLTGTFYNTVIFGSYTLTSVGNSDIFVVKYDPNGNVLWAKSEGGSSWENSNSICSDGFGNTYFTGYFLTPMLSFGTFTLIGSSGRIYVTKYDPSGNVVWAKNWGGTNIDGAAAICANNSGDIFVTGYYVSPTVTFGSYTLTNSSSPGFSDMYITKLDANGNSIWAKSANSNQNENGVSIAAKGNDIFLTASTTSTNGLVSLGTNTFSVPAGADPMIVAQYDINGNLIYCTVLSSGGDDYSAVAIDNNCNAYITGDYYWGSPFVVGTFTLPTQPGETVFTLKLNYNCQPTGITEVSASNDLKLFPNPSAGSLNLLLESFAEKPPCVYEFVLFNSLGQEVYKKEITEKMYNIDLTVYPKGLYNYAIKKGGQRFQGGKLIIE